MVLCQCMVILVIRMILEKQFDGLLLQYILTMYILLFIVKLNKNLVCCFLVYFNIWEAENSLLC